MPLVKLLYKTRPAIQPQALYSHLCRVFKVTESSGHMQLQYQKVDEMLPVTDGLFLDIRAQVKPDRTPEVMQEMKALIVDFAKQADASRKLIVRIELYDPSLDH
eukprot:GEMP01048327.1.p1 GENE.GEMP01048327.1~~GEMP01048327.1.p1  ORF type:complete len:115 (+),score=21.95 GEMP01048327.1:36-347(+)